VEYQDDQKLIEADLSALTINQMKSILSARSIPLPPIKQSKQVYEELLKEHVTELKKNAQQAPKKKSSSVLRRCCKWMLIVITIVVALFVAVIARRVLDSGDLEPLVFHTLYPNCYRLRGPAGIEDIAINSKGIAFLSASDKRKIQLMEIPDPLAGIYTFDLEGVNQDELEKLRKEKSKHWAKKVELVDFPSNLNFHPHGISLYEDSDGKEFLFVVNHHLGLESSVEIFQYRNGKLYFIKHVVHELITSLNDVAATSNATFVATNDNKYANAPWRVAEMLLNFCKGNIINYDGKNIRHLFDNLCYPNGINYRDGLLFFSESAGKTLSIYNWIAGKQENPLFLKKIFLGSNLDNIDIGKDLPAQSPDINLYITGHPWGFGFLKHLIAGSTAPTQVFQVHLDGSTNSLSHEVKEVHLTEGKEPNEIAAASVAAAYKSYLLMGSPIDVDGIEICVK